MTQEDRIGKNVFAQYDHIVSRHTHPPDPDHTDLPPSVSKAEAAEPPQSAPKIEEPYWGDDPNPPKQPASAPKIAPANEPEILKQLPPPQLSLDERKEWAMKKNLGYDPNKSWTDINAERAEKAEKLMLEHLVNPNGASFAQDEKGLEKAYNNETGWGTYYDPETRTEYVKGSQSAQDWLDDFTLLPIGMTKQSERYKQAEKTYNDLINSGKPVDRVVGHSLGGSVALEMQKTHFIPSSRTFGAPVLDLNSHQNPDRYRHPLDPFSILDRGATWGKPTLNPHTYSGYEAFDS